MSEQTVSSRVRQALGTLARRALNAVDVLRLRWQIARLKRRNYDALAETVSGLRRALATKDRALGDAQQQIDARDAQIAKLRQEYAALDGRLARFGADSAETERLALFRRLQPVVTQLPTLRAALDGGADLAARDVLDLLAPLDELLADLGFERIGDAGAQTRFDPQCHQPLGQGARAIVPEDMVRVRYVGYLYHGNVVCKAQVTRAE
jgi:molecular chaperone GrpE (heat shock protein)